MNKIFLIGLLFIFGCEPNYISGSHKGLCVAEFEDGKKIIITSFNYPTEHYPFTMLCPKDGGCIIVPITQRVKITGINPNEN